MAHHAYFVTGERAAAKAAALSYAEHELGLAGANNPDIVQLDFGLFSVEDARKLIQTANLSSTGGTKAIIASMTRVFHEAQNALLKVLEEPSAGVTIILCIPSAGILIPTLRSRLLPLPSQSAYADTTATEQNDSATSFLSADTKERESIITALVNRSKADKDETKQEARREAIELLQGIMRAGYSKLHKASTDREREDTRELLEELSSFMPILYERSAPLKLIFEHLMLVTPKAGLKAKV